MIIDYSSENDRFADGWKVASLVAVSGGLCFAPSTGGIPDERYGVHAVSASQTDPLGYFAFEALEYTWGYDPQLRRGESTCVVLRVRMTNLIRYPSLYEIQGRKQEVLAVYIPMVCQQPGCLIEDEKDLLLVVDGERVTKTCPEHGTGLPLAWAAAALALPVAGVEVPSLK